MVDQGWCIHAHCDTMAPPPPQPSSPTLGLMVEMGKLRLRMYRPWLSYGDAGRTRILAPGPRHWPECVWASQGHREGMLGMWTGICPG